MLYLSEIAPALWHGRVRVIADAMALRTWLGADLDAELFPDGTLVDVYDGYGLEFAYLPGWRTGGVDPMLMGLWECVSVMPCLDTGEDGHGPAGWTRLEVYAAPTVEFAEALRRSRAEACPE